MNTVESVFKSARDIYAYPDDFDYQTKKIPILEVWDKFMIVTNEDYEFYNEEGLWGDESTISKWGEFTEGIIISNNCDMEERSIDAFESVVCLRTPCPKEGIFYDYVPFHYIAQLPDLYKLIKI